MNAVSRDFTDNEVVCKDMSDSQYNADLRIEILVAYLVIECSKRDQYGDESASESIRCRQLQGMDFHGCDKG